MLSCRSEPFYFTSWQSTLAWVVCTLNPETCPSLQIPYYPDFVQFALNYSTVILAAREESNPRAVDVNAAYTFCFWMTIAQALPYIILLVTIILFIIVAVRVPFQVAAAGMQCLVQAICFTHIGGRNND